MLREEPHHLILIAGCILQSTDHRPQSFKEKIEFLLLVSGTFSEGMLLFFVHLVSFFLILKDGYLKRWIKMIQNMSDSIKMVLPT